MNGDYIRGNVDAIILKCLHGGELYGSQIMALIKTASEDTYTLKKPTLYSALKRLEKNKLVNVRQEYNPFGGTKHFYSLTEHGRETLSSKKYDWVYSKLLIDQLVLDRRLLEEQEEKEKVATGFVATTESTMDTFETVAASRVATFFEYNTSPLPNQVVAQVQEPVSEPIVASAPISTFEEIPLFSPKPLPTETVARTNVAVATEIFQPRVSVVVHDVPAVDEYVASAGGYITVPLYKNNRPVTTTHQLGLDMDKVESMTPPWKPFVKHAGEKKTYKFVLYNRLRLASSVVACTVLAIILGITFSSLQATYTATQVNFFAVGWVALATYFLVNVVLFSSHPRYERITTNRSRDVIRRGILTACIAVLALSINVLAGFTAVTAVDHVVYLIVPMIVGSIFLLDGLAMLALKQAPYFVS